MTFIGNALEVLEGRLVTLTGLVLQISLEPPWGEGGRSDAVSFFQGD